MCLEGALRNAVKWMCRAGVLSGHMEGCVERICGEDVLRGCMERIY